MNPRVSRPEAAVMLCLVATGALLRCVSLDHVSIEHFDEGIYASNVWFTEEEGYRYPGRGLYAPPLVPAVIEAALLCNQFAGLRAGLAAIAPGILFGVALIPAVWWSVRRWFSVPAGVSAAALLTFDDVFIQYSRTALTEPMLAVFLIAAIAMLGRTLTESGLRVLLAATVFTALAWMTKYSGWLPLAVGITGSTLWVLEARRGWRIWGQCSVRWGAVLVGAFAIWAGLALSDLQLSGGYADVAANHSRYVVGVSGWWTAATAQFANHDSLQSGLSVFALVAACLIASRVGEDGRFTWNNLAASPCSPSLPLQLSRILALVAVSTLAGYLTVMFGLLAIGLVTEYVGRRKEESDREIGPCLVIAWFLGLAIVTPIYTPYPRLLVPLLLVTAIGAGLGIARLNQFGPLLRQNGRHWTESVILASVACAVLAFGRYSTFVPAWEDRTGLERLAAPILEQADASSQSDGPVRFVVYVFAEPGLFFHLAAQADHRGDCVVQPVADLGFADEEPRIPTFLVVGPRATRTESFQVEWREKADQFQRVGEHEMRPSLLVRLNENLHLAGELTATTESVRIYRVAISDR